jgi:hypothetical protein
MPANLPVRARAGAVGRLVPGVLAALVLLGGCTASDPADRPHLTACQLYTRPQVARVLGGAVDAPATAESATDTLAGRSGCAWTRADGARAVLIELVRTDDMSASVRRTGFSAAARFDAVAHDHPDEELTDPGERVGDRAIFVEEQGTLHALSGRSYLTVEVAATPPSAARSIAIQLARLAIAHLERIEPAD